MASGRDGLGLGAGPGGGRLGLGLGAGHGGLSLGLGVQTGALGVGLGPQQRLGLGGLSLLLALVAGGVGGLAHGGVQLALGQGGLGLGRLLPDDGDLALLGGAGDRAGGVGVGLGLVRLGLELGLTQGQVALALGDLLAGGDLGVTGLTLGVGPRDAGVLLDALLLGHAQGLDVTAGVGDLGDLEHVDLQTHVGHDALGVVEDVALQGVAVGDEVGDRHVADDRAQGADERLPCGVGDGLVRVGLAQEALGGGAHLLVGVAHLDGGHGGDVDVDLVLVLGGDLEADRGLGEGQVLDGLDDRQDEVASTGVDDLDRAPVRSGDQTGEVGGDDDDAAEQVGDRREHDDGDDDDQADD